MTGDHQDLPKVVAVLESRKSPVPNAMQKALNRAQCGVFFVLDRPWAAGLAEPVRGQMIRVSRNNAPRVARPRPSLQTSAQSNTVTDPSSVSQLPSRLFLHSSLPPGRRVYMRLANGATRVRSNGAIYRSIDQACTAYLELNAELFRQAHGFTAAEAATRRTARCHSCQGSG